MTPPLSSFSYFDLLFKNLSLYLTISLKNLHELNKRQFLMNKYLLFVQNRNYVIERILKKKRGNKT